MTSAFRLLEGSPCAGCVHMGWSLLYDEPAGICTFKVRSKRNPERWVSGSWYCEKCGFEFYEPEEWKVEKAAAWEKKNSVPSPENAVPLVRAIELLR